MTSTPVQDELFHTLDPLTRRLNLPSGGNCRVVDTVGFIQKLPTQLVAAFRATLEEVAEANLVFARHRYFFRVSHGANGGG